MKVVILLKTIITIENNSFYVPVYGCSGEIIHNADQIHNSEIRDKSHLPSVVLDRWRVRYMEDNHTFLCLYGSFFLSKPCPRVRPLGAFLSGLQEV